MAIILRKYQRPLLESVLIITIGLLFGITSPLLPVNVASVPEARIGRVSVKTQQAVQNGATFTANIDIGPVSGISTESRVNLAGFQMDVHFDPDILEAVRAAAEMPWDDVVEAMGNIRDSSSNGWDWPFGGGGYRPFFMMLSSGD